MKAYIIRRLLLMIPTFIGISLLTFMMVQLSPGNPVFLRLQGIEGAGNEYITEEIIEQTKELYGLDKPLPQRYALWMWRLVRFDFGDSYKDNRPVLTRMLEALPVTIQLNLISLFLAYAISIPIGVFSATHAGTRRDTAITILLFLLYSLPSFWVAMLLIYFLGGGGGSATLSNLTQNFFEWAGIAGWGPVQWLQQNVLHFKWFPIFGFGTPGAEEWPFHRWLLDRLWHYCLPVFCLTYSSFAVLSRYARAGMIETIRQDYIRTAKAYGFSSRIVVYRYALRNSLIPIVTLLGNVLPALIVGSVIIESIFSLPGMGKLFYDSILGRDYPLVMGIFTFTAILTMLGLLLSDILYAIVDPRISMK